MAGGDNLKFDQTDALTCDILYHSYSLSVSVIVGMLAWWVGDGGGYASIMAQATSQARAYAHVIATGAT